MELPLTVKISKRDAFYYLIVFLNVCLVIVDKGGIGPLAVLALISAPLLFNPAAIIPLLYITSWHNSFALRPVVSIHLYYSLLFFFSLFVPNNRSRYKVVWGIPSYVFFAVPLMFWVLLTGWHSVTGSVAPSLVVFFELALLVLMAKVHLFDVDFSRNCILLIIVVSTVIFTFIALFHPFQVDLGGSELSTQAFRSDIRLTILPEINPNIAARIVVINFIILFAEAFRSKKVLLSLFSMLNLIPVLLCGSRTSFMGMLGVAGLAMLTSRRINWKTLMLIGLMGLLFTVLYSVGSDLNDRKEMSVNSVVDDAGSGRLYTIEGLFKSVIPNHLIMGIGLGRDNYTQMGFGYDADNLYVDSLAQVGLVGFILLFLLYFFFLGDYLSRRIEYRDKMLARLMLIAFLVLGVGISMFDTMGFWFAMTLLVFFRNGEPVLEENRWRVQYRDNQLRLDSKKVIVLDNEKTEEL